MGRRGSVCAMVAVMLIAPGLAGITTACEPLFDTVVKILASDGPPGDLFGDSVSISGDTAIVGASFNDALDSDAGSAYVRQRHQGGVDNWGEVKQLTAGDGAAADRFGNSVSISDDTAIVAARFNDDAGSNAGAVYIFQRNNGGPDNWGQVAKVTASNPGIGDSFGFSVSISGDTAIVGAIYNDAQGSNAGSAYVLQRNHGGENSWGVVRMINAGDADPEDFFGYSVSISGDTAIVGAIRETNAGHDAGAAYIYRRDLGGIDNWGEVTKIVASDAAADRDFGLSVSISGNTAIVGAHYHDHVGFGAGAAYIFERNHPEPGNWGEVTRITASDAAADDYFGYSVSISSDTVIVGARQDDDAGGDSGSAYIFRRDHGGPNIWGELMQLTAGDGAAGDNFGRSVSVSNCTAIVGVPGDDDAGPDSGSAYVFFDLAPSIPTVSEWGMVVMVLLLVTAGTVVFRRGHRAVSKE